MKLRRLLTLGVLLAAGCKPHSENNLDGVTMKIDEVQVARRQWAESRESMVADLLAHPAKLRWADEEIMEILNAQKERALAAYRTKRDDCLQRPSVRLHAALAAQQLGELVNFEEIVVFAEKSPDATLCLLADLPQIFPEGTPVPPEIRQFVARAAGGTDDWNCRVAARWAGWRKIDEASAPILAALRRNRDIETGDELGVAAAQLRPSAELLTLLEGRLRPAGLIPGTKGLFAIASLGKATDDPALRARAAADCLAYLLEQTDQNFLDAGAMDAIDLIATSKPREVARQMLEKLGKHARWKLVREHANEALDSTTATEAKDDALKPGPSAEDRSRTWARSCVTHGVLTATEAEAVLKAHPTSSSPEGESGLYEFMANAGRAVYFDTETGNVPCRHDLLVRNFARATVGRFAPEAVLEIYSETKDNKSQGQYLLQFVHGNRVYRTTLRDLGDWYDVAGVLDLIHRALADASVSDRFVQLRTGDQMTAIVFGSPGALQRLATAEGVKLESNTDQPRETGQAFEKRILKELR